VKPSHRRRRTAAALGAAVVVSLSSGCFSQDKAPVAARPTPISQLRTATMTIPRVEFCSNVPKRAVADALGTTSSRLAAYRAGDRTAVAGTTDQVAENGCAWLASNGPALARAWVFASPADATMARDAIRDARSTPGCRLVGSPPFGAPSLTQVCDSSGTLRVRHAGLFGTSWLTCELSDTGTLAVVRKRADAWCVQVASTLNGMR